MPSLHRCGRRCAIVAKDESHLCPVAACERQLQYVHTLPWLRARFHAFAALLLPLATRLDLTWNLCHRESDALVGTHNFRGHRSLYYAGWQKQHVIMICLDSNRAGVELIAI